LKKAAALGGVASDVLVWARNPQDSVSKTAPPILPMRFMPYQA
jgi:hypothetical protein